MSLPKGCRHLSSSNFTDMVIRICPVRYNSTTGNRNTAVHHAIVDKGEEEDVAFFKGEIPPSILKA